MGGPPHGGWLDACMAAIETTNKFAQLSDVKLHYAVAGDGPLVVMLHGFPDHWYSWRKQIPALAEKGFRVVAPDMRGYNLSDKPRGVSAYRSERVAQDIVELVGHLGYEQASFVGHDWGGAIAWTIATEHIDAVDRLAILSCPHPADFARRMWHPEQLRKSWYMFFFQLPALPEKALSSAAAKNLRRIYETEPRRPLSAEEIERQVDAMLTPGTLRSAINYYRAAFRTNPLKVLGDDRSIDKDVLVIWGEHDRALRPELATPGTRFVPSCNTHVVPGAAHWVHWDEPGIVNDLLLAHLQRARA